MYELYLGCSPDMGVVRGTNARARLTLHLRYLVAMLPATRLGPGNSFVSVRFTG